MIVCDCGQAESSTRLKEHLAECGARIEHSFQLIPGVAVGMTPEALKQFFARYPNAKVIADRRRHIPPMPFGPDEWSEVAGPGETLPTSPGEPHMSPLGISLIKADEVHALGIDGKDVRICIVDSGIDFTHPDLIGTAIIGADGNPLASDFTETDLIDTLGHGTAVAGCIAAQARQVYTITDEQSGAPVAYTRIKGIAPGVKLMSAKVFDSRVSTGYDSAIIAALEWAAENGAHIVNMSLGGVTLPNDGNDPLARAVTALRDRGILVTVSAGNEGGGHGTLKSPGSSPGALTVGASTMYRSFAEMGFLAEPGKWTADQLASFSSLGPSADGRLKPDVLAPGAYDWGLAPVTGSEEGQSFQLFGGTSQAAPLMCGAAALVYQAFHKVRGRYPTPDELIQVVCSTADDLGLPAHMQGAGRVNSLRAVQVALGQAPAVICSAPAPVVVVPGKEVTLKLDLTNTGAEPAELNVQGTHFRAVSELGTTFNGQITTAQSQQDITFDVAPGTDLIQVSLDWPSNDHGPRSPRLMVAVYDPQGRFVNYQRPNSSGDVELGKSVDTWIARPAPGRWTARVVLRLGVRDTVQPYSLSTRIFRRAAWEWVKADVQNRHLAPGESRAVSLTVAVPAGISGGTYPGHIMVGGIPVPLSVVVPIALQQGKGTFEGAFQHGYQGSWGNGDWLYHDLVVPAGVKSVIASLQWPDVDNALEFYLINPAGHAVMGRSNSGDILDDGNSFVQGGQAVLANPEPGTWRLALHSFAFCGRSMPEPYLGTVEVGGELVTPRIVHMHVAPGGQAPMALMVRNPGRMPLTVQAAVQSTDVQLLWQTLSGQLKSGVTEQGQAHGEGHITLANVEVPQGARQVGVLLNWDKPDTEVSVSLFDPVAQGDRATMAGSNGQVMVMETHPVPGTWTIMAGVTTAAVENQTIQLKGAVFVVAPRSIEDVQTHSVTVQPGGHAVLPVTLNLPKTAAELSGRIVVTSSHGDRLGEVAFRIEADERTNAHTEIATTKE